MLKKKIELLLIILFSLFLVNTTAYSFHNQKENAKKDGETIFEDPDTTKDQIRQKYCARKVVEKGGASEQEENEKGQLGWSIYGYHKLKPITAGKKLILSKEFKYKLDFKINYDTTLETVLKIHCLQYADDRPIKYKKSSMLGLYKQIAEKNNLINDNGDPDIKMPIGEDLYKNGIIIGIPNVVYYIPDYLIAKYDKYQKKQKRKKQEEKKKKEKDAKDKKWVKENFSIILEKAKSKKRKFNDVQNQLLENIIKLEDKSKKFQSRYENILVDINDLIDFDIVNTKNKKIVSKLKELRRLKTEKLEAIELEVTILDGDLDKERKLVENLFSKEPKNYKKLRNLVSKNYYNLDAIIQRTNESSKKKELVDFNKLLEKIDFKNLDKLKMLIEKKTSAKQDFINDNNKIIDKAYVLINETKVLDSELSDKSSFTKYFVYGGIALLVIFGIGLVVYILLQRKELTNLKSETKKSESRFSELQGQIKSTSEQIRKSSTTSSSQTHERVAPVVKKPKTQGEILADKFDEMVSDYKDSLEDFSKVAAFKQKWNGLALSRKERQDGTKTILINSTRAFEKAEIWCVNFSDKYFAFPGSSVKSNMAAYMNLDFEKASRDFKGVFAISSGSSYITDPALLRRGGAGFVVEKPGKLTFPT